MYLSGCERVPCASCGLAQARLLTQRVLWTAGVVVERALACMKEFGHSEIEAEVERMTGSKLDGSSLQCLRLLMPVAVIAVCR